MPPPNGVIIPGGTSIGQSQNLAISAVLGVANVKKLGYTIRKATSRFRLKREADTYLGTINGN
jgi:hypothetical protein